MKLNLGGGFQNKDISKPSRSEKFIRLKNLYGVVGREGGVAGCSIRAASQSPFSILGRGPEKTDFEFQNVKKSFKCLQILLFIFFDLKSIQNSINEKSLV